MAKETKPLVVEDFGVVEVAFGIGFIVLLVLLGHLMGLWDFNLFILLASGSCLFGALEMLAKFRK